MVEHVLRPHALYLLHELAQQTVEIPTACVITNGREGYYTELVEQGLLKASPYHNTRMPNLTTRYTVTAAGMKLNELILEGAIDGNDSESDSDGAD